MSVFVFVYPSCFSLPSLPPFLLLSPLSFCLSEAASSSGACILWMLQSNVAELLSDAGVQIRPIVMFSHEGDHGDVLVAFFSGLRLLIAHSLC